MTRRRLTFLLALYLIATAVATPLAYLLGMAQRVEAASMAPPFGLSGPGAFVDTTEHVWWCIQFGDYPGLRNNHRERVCGPGRGVGHKRRAAWSPRRGGPLQTATALMIAGEGFGYKPTLFQVPEPPFAVAPINGSMTPVGGSIGAPGGHASGGGSFGGQPAVLIAGLGKVTPLDPPAVVPVPAGFPLMMTGIGALWLAARRRRRFSGQNGR